MVKVLLVLVYFVTVVTIVYGWVMNLITLINGGYETIIQLVVSIVGLLVAPIGAILYYVVG